MSVAANCADKPHTPQDQTRGADPRDAVDRNGPKAATASAPASRSSVQALLLLRLQFRAGEDGQRRIAVERTAAAGATKVLRGVTGCYGGVLPACGCPARPGARA
eukprot:1189591-Prorocentrum_minimum.AAC.1